jgi:hypothetical protein
MQWTLKIKNMLYLTDKFTPQQFSSNVVKLLGIPWHWQALLSPPVHAERLAFLLDGAPC